MILGGLWGWGRWVCLFIYLFFFLFSVLDHLLGFSPHYSLYFSRVWSNDCSILGYHMAKNLRAKIPATDTLVIRDVNEETAARFVEEARKDAKSNGAGENTAKVLIARDAREVAEQSVSRAHDCFWTGIILTNICSQ